MTALFDPYVSKIAVTGTVQDKIPMVSEFIVSGDERWNIKSDADITNGDLVLVIGDFDWEYAPGYENDPPEFHVRLPQVTILSRETS